MKRSTFSFFFLFLNGYVEDSQGFLALRGYCRAPGGACAAALGKEKASSSSEITFTEMLLIVWRGFEPNHTTSSDSFQVSLLSLML